jgi:hypothetical protein
MYIQVALADDAKKLLSAAMHLNPLDKKSNPFCGASASATFGHNF